MTNENVISTLNNLIETNKDGQDGFKQAAEGVQNSDIKSAFYEYCSATLAICGRTANAVRELGGDPERFGQHFRRDSSRLDQYQISRHRTRRSGDFKRSRTRRRFGKSGLQIGFGRRTCRQTFRAIVKNSQPPSGRHTTK